jgi:hypothetical protein
MTNTEEKPIINKPWKNESFHSSYESADAKRNKLIRIWDDDEKHKGMQVKVKRLSSRNQFVVKTRLHPDFEQKQDKEKKKKNAKRNKKNKRANEGGKYDPQATS